MMCTLHLFPYLFVCFQNSCIYQTCAVSELNSVGVCIPVFQGLMNIHLEYRLKMVYHINSPEVWNFSPAVIFDDNIMNVIGLKSSDGICFAKLLDITYSLEFMEIRTVFIRYVNAANIEQVFNDYEKNIEVYNEMVQVKNKSTFLLQMDKSDIYPVLEDSVTLLKFSRSHRCPNNIAMSKLQFCDTITFHKNKFKIYGNGTIIIDNLLFTPGDYIPRHSKDGTIKYVQVCLDDYISKYMFINGNYRDTSSAGYGWRQRSSILYLLCVVFVVIQQYTVSK